MRWLKVPEAAQEWAGGLNPKTLYAAIRAGRLKAARIGAGRNVLVCEVFVDEWLTGSVRQHGTSGHADDAAMACGPACKQVRDNLVRKVELRRNWLARWQVAQARGTFPPAIVRQELADLEVDIRELLAALNGGAR